MQLIDFKKLFKGKNINIVNFDEGFRSIKVSPNRLQISFWYPLKVF